MSPRSTRKIVVGALLGAVVAGCSWMLGVDNDVQLAPELDVDAGEDGDDGSPAVDAPTNDATDGSRTDSGASDAPSTPDTSAFEAGEIPDGGLLPLQGSVWCGNVSCSLATQECCYPNPGTPACSSLTSFQCTGVGSVCDETSDCDGGICCIKAVHSYGIETECRSATSCSPDPHLCRRNSECSSRNCVPWKCAGGTVETCSGVGSDAGCLP